MGNLILSANPPTVAGFYWMRFNWLGKTIGSPGAGVMLHDLCIGRVENTAGDDYPEHFHVAFEKDGEAHYLAVDDVECEWAGPIPLPEKL